MAAIEPRPHDGVLLPDGSVDEAHRVTLSYIDRSRHYYAARGYETPYRWETNDHVPFTTLRRPLAASRVAVVTTAFPFEHHAGPRPPKSVRAMTIGRPGSQPPSMYTGDLFWHKEATHTDDVETFLPLATLSELAADGRVGSINDRFFSIPTTYSRRSARTDAETIVSWCEDDDVDLVVLIPL